MGDAAGRVGFYYFFDIFFSISDFLIKRFFLFYSHERCGKTRWILESAFGCMCACVSCIMMWCACVCVCECVCVCNVHVCVQACVCDLYTLTHTQPEVVCV